MVLEQAELGRTSSELVLLTIRPVRWLTGWCVRSSLGKGRIPATPSTIL